MIKKKIKSNYSLRIRLNDCLKIRLKIVGCVNKVRVSEELRDNVGYVYNRLSYNLVNKCCILECDILVKEKTLPYLCQNALNTATSSI